MAELNAEERLALAVQAHVAAIRAERAKERAALIEERTEPLRQAAERFAGRHGRLPDLDDAGDREAFMRLVSSAGGGDVSREDLMAAAGVGHEAAELRAEAADALKAVADAMPEGQNMRDWVGVDDATLDRAIQEALGEGAATG
jgi:hypothetical protein